MRSAGLTRNAREDTGLEQLAPKLKCTRPPLAIDKRVNMAYPRNNGLLVAVAIAGERDGHRD